MNGLGIPGSQAKSATGPSTPLLTICTRRRGPMGNGSVGSVPVPEAPPLSPATGDRGDESAETVLYVSVGVRSLPGRTCLPCSCLWATPTGLLRRVATSY